MQQNNVIYNNPSNLDQRLLSIQTLRIPTQSSEGFIDTVLPGFPANNIAIANNTNASLFIVSRVIDYIPNDAVEVGAFETRSFPIMTSTEFRVFYRGLVSEEKDTINIFLSNQTIPLFGAKFNPNDEALSVTVVGGEIALLPGDEHIGNVAIDAPLPAGTNHLGSVTASLELTDPLPTGTNHIGSVTVDNATPIAVTGDVTATIDTTTPIAVTGTVSAEITESVQIGVTIIDQANPLTVTGAVDAEVTGSVSVANSPNVTVLNKDDDPIAVDVVNVDIMTRPAAITSARTKNTVGIDTIINQLDPSSRPSRLISISVPTTSSPLIVGFVSSGLNATTGYFIGPGQVLDLSGVAANQVYYTAVTGTSSPFTAIIID